MVEYAQKLKKFPISTVYYFAIVQAERPKIRVYIVQLSVMALVNFSFLCPLLGEIYWRSNMGSLLSRISASLGVSDLSGGRKKYVRREASYRQAARTNRVRPNSLYLYPMECFWFQLILHASGMVCLQCPIISVDLEETCEQRLSIHHFGDRNFSGVR